MDDARGSRHRREYVARINRVMDYVERNLDGDLSLATLAAVACFSPFHFHRLFKAVVGETLNEFVRRVRAETAATKLLANPNLSITDVALHCGYSSPATFAREFRRRFGMSASSFRAGGHEDWSTARASRKIGQAERKVGKDAADDAGYPEAHRLQEQGRRGMEATFEIKEMPELHVAYIRHIGPYNQIGQAFERLMAWAGPRGLLRFPETSMLGVYHDSPDVTDPDKLRSDACITVPEDTVVGGDVATMTIPGGQFAVGHFVIDMEDYGAAWDKLMGEYLPDSGYQPDDRLCYELYLNDPAQHPEGKHIVDICEPVRPL